MNNQGLHNRPTFSSLSRDVKTLIYDFAYGRDAYYASNSPKRLLGLTRPISKAFLEVQRVTLYGDVEFASSRKLDNFDKTVLTRLHLARLVTDVAIELKWAWDGGIEFPVRYESDDKLLPSSQHLAAFFQALPNLEYLVIAGSSKLAQLAVAPSNANGRFRRLERLYLHLSFDDFCDPFNPTHFQPMQYWTQLEQLTYDVERDVDSVHHEPTPFGTFLDTRPSASFPYVKRLDLSDPLSESDVALRIFPAFPALTTLILKNTAPSSASFTTEVLESLPKVYLLTFLDLSRTDPSPHPSDISPVLPFLRSLKVLRLSGEGFLVKSKFFEYLKKLSALHTLPFGLGVEGVTTSVLGKLLLGVNGAPGAKEGSAGQRRRVFHPELLEKLLHDLTSSALSVKVESTAVWCLTMGEEVTDIDYLVANMEGYKERYRQFAIGLECRRMAWGE